MFVWHEKFYLWSLSYNTRYAVFVYLACVQKKSRLRLAKKKKKERKSDNLFHFVILQLSLKQYFFDQIFSKIDENNEFFYKWRTLKSNKDNILLLVILFNFFSSKILYVYACILYSR